MNKNNNTMTKHIQKTIYQTPMAEVLEVAMESRVLTASGNISLGSRSNYTVDDDDDLL